MRLTFNNDKEFIEKLTEIVITNLDNDKFGVDELVHASGLSHATVLHKIKSISQKTISQFICEIRLHKALEMLQNETVTSAEVAYKVGFGSPAYFSSCFHDYFGYTPGEVKKKVTFNNETIVNESNNKSNILKSLKRLFAKRPLLIRVTQVFIVLVILLLAHIAFFDFPVKFGNEKPDNKMSIAVLPFKNLSNEKENQYLADGITEGVTKQLNKLGHLKVISRTSSEHFRESNKSIPQIAKELDVNYILEGSVQCNYNKARISVQLIDADKDQHILSEQFDRELEDIFALQSNIVRQVAERLQMTLTNEEIAKIEKVPTENMEAYNYYLLGRFFWNKRTKEGLEKSIVYFEKAIETDTLYALAYAGLADALFIQAWWGWGEKAEYYKKAKQVVFKAIELDDSIAEAYAVLGGILNYWEWKWEEARIILQHSIELNPNCAIAHQYYAELLDILGEHNSARNEINRAIELDPLSFMHRLLSADLYYRDSKYYESLKECEKVLEFNPENKAVYNTISQNYFELKNDLMAVKAIINRFAADTSTQKLVPVIQKIYTRSGTKGVLLWLTEREKTKKQPDAFALSRIYARICDKQNALFWLETGYINHSTQMPRITVDPAFDILRSEPRFLKIIDEMGLTNYHKRKPKPVTTS
jgi:TolB-like protein/AraC-like DNA-binding protein